MEDFPASPGSEKETQMTIPHPTPDQQRIIENWRAACNDWFDANPNRRFNIVRLTAAELEAIVLGGDVAYIFDADPSVSRLEPVAIPEPCMAIALRDGKPGGGFALLLMPASPVPMPSGHEEAVAHGMWLLAEYSADAGISMREYARRVVENEHNKLTLAS